MSAREALYTRAQSREVDRELIARGVPGVVLMENAGRGAAERVLAWMRERGLGAAAPVVLVGPGNNGGDGLVIARHLALAGLSPRVLALGDPASLRGDAGVMRDAWRAVGGAIGALDASVLLDDDVVIDGLFGTGLSRPLDGDAASAVRAANRRASRPLSIALDVPSGLDADTGAALGDPAGVFSASHTLTFGASKPGLHTGFGARASGHVEVVALGAALPSRTGEPGAWLARTCPVAPRAPDAHKGDNGRVLVVGGSAGTTGAALLSARGAHRAGAGLVTIGSRAAASLDMRVLETMTSALPDDPDALEPALGPLLERADAVVIGPGMGRDAWGERALGLALDRAERAVFDADALTLLAKRGGLPPGRVRVLTPHPLEMARLLGERDADAVNADRLTAARECAKRYASVVVLKGAGTVVAAPGDGAPNVVACAEPALGVAGSGDVLAGALGARLAEKGPFDPVARALEAVVAHARAGERLHRERGTSRGFLASEVADGLGTALEASD